jgi:hypothetical protein
MPEDRYNSQNQDGSKSNSDYPYGNQSPGGGYVPYEYQSPYSRNYQRQDDGRGNYRWSIEDYQAAGQRKPPKRGRGLMAVGILLALVLVAGIVGLSAYGAYSLAVRPTENSAAASAQSNPGSSQPVVRSDVPGLTIMDPPSGAENETSSSNGRLSTVEIARRVRASVVGVARYSAEDTFVA